MDTNLKSQFRINDYVFIAAKESSLDACHNGQVGRITGFVDDWFVVVSVNGHSLRLLPGELRICPQRG
jgi:hypothetical protein